MAAGYARATGRIPAVLMTSGPGITNALTGLASANADGIPMIALGGEVPRASFGRGALQEGSRYQLDVLSMARSVSKSAIEITSAQGALGQLRRALATASSGRQGPVFVSLPIDLANDQLQRTRTSSHVETHFSVDPALIATTALHAEELTIPHPVTGAEVKITAPWPKDFTVAIKNLRRHAPGIPWT